MSGMKPASSDAPRAVDGAFAGLLLRLDPSTDPRVLEAATRAMLAVAQGHAALDLRGLAADAEHGDSGGTIAGNTGIADLRAALQSSPWVSTPQPDDASDPRTPLVLEGDLLYLRRYREYERRLAEGLRRIAGPEGAGGNAGIDALAPLFARLFPKARDGDLQARAAALALVRNLLLLTGGPGTGKTTTLARLLVLQVARCRASGAAPPRIALAAPTGRAADRMAQSMAHAVATLRTQGMEPELLDALPTGARTLHRLLGPIPDRPRFRHDAAHPLAYDIVVVDEASMVDLPLMCKLVEAVPPGASLLLVGDPDQLPSVEAGDVLASIVRAAGDSDTLPPAVHARLSSLLGPPPTGDLFGDAAHAPLAGHRAHLRRGWRQSSALDLAPLAEAVRLGDADRAIALLHAGTLRGVEFHAGVHDPLAGPTRESLLAPWRELLQACGPDEALGIASRTRVLTALRDGPQGAAQLNARIEEALAGAHREPYFHGRLLLVTENSYRHGLFNGDTGLCLRDATGAMVAWFAGADGPRGFHPAALPAHASAFAMTVHKAQGSEYDHVWLQLPRQDARPLSRELVYTAMTRARDALHVCGGDEVVRLALGRRASRVSGLESRLR